MDVTRLVVGELQVNCYVLTPGEASGEAAVIDPGGDADKIAEVCHKKGVTPRYIINTHGHHDHIGADGQMVERFPDADFCIGEGEKELLLDPQKNLSAGFGPEYTPPEPDRLLADGDTLELGDVTLEVMDTPGHTAGHISLAARQDDETAVFCGDLLFAGSVGRTDLPGGDAETLARSVREKILSLPDQTTLLPGHGPETTVGQEKQSNPFVGKVMNQ